jgi:hypothetical protein
MYRASIHLCVQRHRVSSAKTQRRLLRGCCVSETAGAASKRGCIRFEKLDDIALEFLRQDAVEAADLQPVAGCEELRAEVPMDLVATIDEVREDGVLLCARHIDRLRPSKEGRMEEEDKKREGGKEGEV